MQAKKTNTIERNNTIRGRFAKLDAQNKFKNDYMIEILSKEFFLSKKTIENIVFNRV